MKYIFRRMSALFITLILVSVITFLAFNVVPGDPAVVILGIDASPQKIAALRQELGLNQSLPERYLTWMGHFVKGDLGKSLRFAEPVKNLLADRIPVTFWLTILTFAIIIAFSIPLGIYAAQKEGTVIDTAINLVCQINLAIPPFFLGVVSMILFGIVLKWFTPGQYVDYHRDFGGFLKYLLIPAWAIALPKIATVVKFLRTSVIQQMSLGYVRTAYSKGNKDNAVLYGHVLKNALITVITLMGMIVADILAGSIIIEQLFALPGIGRLLVTSISFRDFPLIQAVVIYIALMVVAINFLVDLSYQVIDPRIRVK